VKDVTEHQRSGVLAPRLMSLKQAAEYLGISYWSVRDYALQGKLQTVTLPPLTPKEGDAAKRSMKRWLIERAELDAFVERCKR